MGREQFKKGFRLVILIGVPVLILYFLYSVRIILLPFFLAVLVAYFLNPLVIKLEKRRLSRNSALFWVYLILSAFILSFGLYGIPKLSRELVHFGEMVPSYTAEIQSFLKEAQDKYSSFALPESLRQVLDEKISQLENGLIQAVRGMMAGFSGVFSFVLSIAVAPFLAFYILKDLENIKRGIEGLLPSRWRIDFLAVLRDIDEIITGFIKGNLTVAFLVGLLTTIGYSLVGMEHSLLLGFVAGATDLIPFFGPFLGAIPAVALALLESKTMAIKVILVVLVTQQIESQILTPKIMGDRMGLNPLVIIFALLAGGELFGLGGILLAVPIAAIIRVIARYVFYKLVE